MTTRSPLTTSEDGAVAILYSVALLLMLGLLAITIDLGALRYDRAHSQTVADMAAIAGGFELDVKVGGSPEAACLTAWNYFLANSSEDPETPPDCAGVFPNNDEFTTCPSEPLGPALGTTENYEFRVWWPIPDDSDFLNIDADDDGTFERSYEPDTDGDDPCERIAVHVGRSRGFVFGAALDSNWQTGSTGAPAVARSVIGDDDEDIASLVILDPTACEALFAKGGGNGGGVWVREGPGGEPGIINVDSDGSECSDGYTVDVEGSGAGRPSDIKAGVVGVDGKHGIVGDNGIIISHAIGAGACDGCGYDSGEVPSHVAPQPIAGPVVTREPVEHRWNCKDDYPIADDPVPHHPIGPCEGSDEVPEDSAYIDTLESFVTNPIVTSNPAASGFQMKTECTITDTQTWTLNAGEHGFWVDCPGGFRIDGTVEIPEGNLVITGDLVNRGTLLVNAATTGGCSTKGADATSSDDDISHDNWLVVTGDLVKRNTGARLELGSAGCRGTSVLLRHGVIDFAGGSSILRWVAPIVPSMEHGPATLDLDLEDLSLWSESSREHKLAGDVSDFEIEGVFYVPNADDGAGFEYAGSGAMGQQKAQFFTYRMLARGNGKLDMTPDPERTLKTTKLEGVSLIR